MIRIYLELWPIMSFINSYVGTGTSKTSETTKFFSPSPLLDTWDDRNPSWWSLQNEQLSSLGCFRFGTGDAKSDVPESEILWSLLLSASLANSQIVSHCTILGNGGTRRICPSVHIYYLKVRWSPHGTVLPDLSTKESKTYQKPILSKRETYTNICISYHIIVYLLYTCATSKSSSICNIYKSKFSDEVIVNI